MQLTPKFLESANNGCAAPTFLFPRIRRRGNPLASRLRNLCAIRVHSLCTTTRLRNLANDRLEAPILGLPASFPLQASHSSCCLGAALFNGVLHCISREDQQTDDRHNRCHAEHHCSGVDSTSVCPEDEVARAK